MSSPLTTGPSNWLWEQLLFYIHLRSRSERPHYKEGSLTGRKKGNKQEVGGEIETRTSTSRTSFGYRSYKIV